MNKNGLFLVVFLWNVYEIGGLSVIPSQSIYVLELD